MKIVRFKGIWNNKYKVIVFLIILVIFVVIIVNFVKIYNIIFNVLLVLVWIVCVKFICEIMFNLVVIYWSNIVIKLEIKIIDINKYWKFCFLVIEVD